MSRRSRRLLENWKIAQVLGPRVGSPGPRRILTEPEVEMLQAFLCELLE